MNLNHWRAAFSSLRSERDLEVLILGVYREGVRDGRGQLGPTCRQDGKPLVLPNGAVVSWRAPTNANDEWSLVNEAGRILCLVTPYCEGPRGVMGWQIWAEGEFYLLLDDAMAVAESRVA